MKKIISVILCVIFILSFSVCSFGATPTSGVSVQNWPTYFTGQWDATIAHDLGLILADIQAYLPNISTWSEQINTNLSSFLDLAVQYYPIFSNNLVNLNTKLYDLNTFIQQDFFDLVDFRAGDIVSAIGGTTSAVSSFESHLLDNLQREIFDYQRQGTYGYLVYMLQQVLADEDDLAFKQKNKANEKAVIQFAETGTGNGISYLSSVSSSISSFGFLSDIISMDYALDETFEYIRANIRSVEPWVWFTDVNKNEINGSSSSTFSARGVSDNSDDVEIVTNYLGENKLKIFEFLEGRNN